MYQLVEGAKFLTSILINPTHVDMKKVTISNELVQELHLREVTAARLERNIVCRGDSIPVFYDQLHVAQELQQREAGFTLSVENGEVRLHYTELQMHVLDYQFQYVKDAAFVERHQQKMGLLSFDDRWRVLLNPKNNFVGVWVASESLAPKDTLLEEAIFHYVQTRGKKIKFTRQTSFILIHFGVQASCFLVTAGKVNNVLLSGKQQLNLWENFLNKNSFSLDLHLSLNEVDQLEQQVTLLSREFAYMQKLLRGECSEQPSLGSQYCGLLRQSSQKLFTGRSHMDTRRGYQLSMGQLSENSFYQDAPLINAIQH